jgi:hypothetical protein
MIPGFEAIVEERIKKAQKEGAFDNLEGTSKPLKFEDENVPEELRLATKILKNSGFLPPEVELRKKISQVGQLLDQVETNSPEQIKLTKKINYLLTKLDAIRADRIGSPLLSDTYRSRLIKKMS